MWKYASPDSYLPTSVLIDLFAIDLLLPGFTFNKESATVGAMSYPKGASENDFKKLSDMISSLQSAFDKCWDKCDDDT